MDQQKFGARVQELLHRKGVPQTKLAESLKLTDSSLSRILKNERTLTPDRAKGCILFLAEETCIAETGDVKDLLTWGGCGDFSETDWDSWPLNNLRPSEIRGFKQLVTQQQAPTYNNLPYSRNSLFTGREDIFKGLLDTFLNIHNKGAFVAICGLAGMGKTQLVVEYIFRYQYLYHAILWVRADSYDAIVADFVMLGGMLDLPEKHEQDSLLVVYAVRKWLSNHSKWLLILDNVEDLNILSAFLPSDHQGHIVLTTQAQLLYTDVHKINLEKMSLEESALLLLRRADKIALTVPLDQAALEDRANALEILGELDGLPLAVDQAGAYMQGGRCDLKEYLVLYRTRRMQLLSNRSTIQHGHPASVVTTFTLLFERIQQSNVAAIELLRFLAFLHPDAIPKELAMTLLHGFDSEPSNLVADPVQWHDTLDELLKYSLVRLLTNDSLSMHRLVQAVLQDTMEISMQQRLVSTVIHTIYHAMISSDSETMSQYRRYLSHAQYAITFINKWKELHFDKAAYLLIEVSRYLRTLGLYERVESYCLTSVEIIETLRAFQHVDRTVAYSNLANLYEAQGRYEEAKQYFRQSVIILEKRSPSEDTSLLALSYCNLANCDRHLKNLVDAEKKAFQAVELIEQVRGAMHPDVAYCLKILATIYRDQERYEEAVPYYERALMIRERVHTQDHPEVAAALNDLATVYVALNEYEKSEPLNRRALVIYQKVYGHDHPEVARCLICLSDFYTFQDDIAQAVRCNQEALEIYEKTIGAEHPRAIEPLGNIAALAVKQGDFLRAQKFYKQALELGEMYSYEDIGWIVLGYAMLLTSAGQVDEADNLKRYFKDRLDTFPY